MRRLEYPGRSIVWTNATSMARRSGGLTVSAGIHPNIHPVTLLVLKYEAEPGSGDAIFAVCREIRARLA
jgi:hypothetical protein